MKKDYLSEDEKRYIKEKIMEPMKVDLERSILFDTIPRAKLMLESSLQRIKFEKAYEARIIFDRQNDNQYVIRLQARKKDCEEFLSLDYPLTLRK